MAKRRGLIMIVLSLVMGAGAAWAASHWVATKTDTDRDAVKGTLVVAASMPIAYSTKVEGRHLKFVEIPEDAVPPGYFTSLEDVEGRIATTNIARGEILLAERFAAHDGGSTLSALVSENLRAVTVRVNDVIGVAGFLLPNNRVDVLSSRKDNNRRAVIETILRDIKVLAVDQTASTEQNEPVIVRAVTLEMSPSQAELLVKARTEGEIQLTLRNPGEREEIPKPEVKVAAVKAPAPVKKRIYQPVSQSTTVIVIRGTKVDTTKTKT